jgi:hypothetical protein
MPKILFPLAAASIAATLAIPSADAQPKLSNLGTLTCTAATANDSPRVDVKLSCNFKATSGETRDYEGVATRQGAAGFPSGKHVLVWSVMGTPAAGSDKAPELQGMFRGETGGAGSPELVGGAKGSVRLVPVTGTAQIDAAVALTVLSLSLTPMRA